MLYSEKELFAQMSAFELMLNNHSAEHVHNACKTYNYDFFNDRSTNASEDVSIKEPLSPFTWAEEENNVEYFKPTVRLELKPRMSVSTLLSDKVTEMKANGSNSRYSHPGGLSRVSIFSQTTSASTTLEESFVSMHSGTSVSRCFEMFSSSEVKNDDGSILVSVTETRSRTFKGKLTQPVYEEECESGDESINNRGSELDDRPIEHPKTANFGKQSSECSNGSEQSSGRKHKLHSRDEV